MTAVLLAAIALVLTRCLNMNDAYGSIIWESLVLIAGMLPMATALEKTGGIEIIVSGLVEWNIMKSTGRTLHMRK